MSIRVRQACLNSSLGIRFNVLAVLACLFMTIPHADLVIAQQTNIIVILADDLGWTDTSVGLANNGNQSDFYQTPTLELLASQGMSFNNAYTCGANCAPMRASFMTGQYAIRSTNNVFNVGSLNRGNNAINSTMVGPSQGLSSGEDQIPASAYTMAEVLKTANYATAHFGKFHVGTGSGSNSVTIQGFDQNFGGGSNGGPGNYFSNGTTFGGNIGTGLDPYASDYTSAQSQALTQSEVLTGTRKHVTDAITEGVVDFIGQSQSKSGTPFFLHIGHYAVHSPINGAGRSDLVAKYQGLPTGQMHDNVHYAALIEGIDQSTNQILEYLASTPDVNNPGQMLNETTLIMFFSDNGGRTTQTANEPLRGQKGEYAEGGIRVPLIIWMPSMVPAATVNCTPVMSADFVPTFAELADVDLPSVLPVGYETIDGISLLPIFADENAVLDRQNIFWHFPGYLIDATRNQRPQSIIRQGDLKLIFDYESRTYQLFDVKNDIGETTDLINESEFAETAIQMSALLREFLVDNNAIMPTYRASGKTVEYPDLIEDAGDVIVVAFDPGNGNSPNNSQAGGDGNWLPFGDNVASITNTYSITIDELELTIAAFNDSGAGNWGINSQGIGIFSSVEGTSSSARRINGNLGEGIELTFDQDVNLRSLRLGSFNAREQMQVSGDGVNLTIVSNDQGPAFDYDLGSLFLMSGTTIQLSSVSDDFLFNEISVEIELPVKGDVNQDGVLNLLDVAPFVDVLSAGTYQVEADVNCDDVVNLLDVSPFVEILSGG